AQDPRALRLRSHAPEAARPPAGIVSVNSPGRVAPMRRCRRGAGAVTFGAMCVAAALAVMAASPPSPAAVALPAPPWSKAPLSATATAGARLALARWKVAENRSDCAPLAFASVGAPGKGATA